MKQDIGIILSALALMLIACGPAWGQGSYVRLNGAFERYDARGVPYNWTLSAKSAPDGERTEARMTDDSWKGRSALYLGSLGEGQASAVVELPVDSRDLRMLFLGTAEFHYKAVASGASGSNLLFSLDLFDIDGNLVTGTGFSPPADHIGDDRWHRHAFNVSLFDSRRARTMRITFSVNRAGVKGHGEWLVDELQIYGEPSSLEIGDLAFDHALVAVGEPFRMSINVTNNGGALFYDLYSGIQLAEGLRSTSGTSEHLLGVVEPGIPYRIVWELVAEDPGTYMAKIDNWSPENASISDPLVGIVGAAEFSQPASRPIAPGVLVTDEEIVLCNSHIRLVFPVCDDGFGLCGIQCWDGGWRDMGASLPLGHAVHVSDSGEDQILLLTPTLHRQGLGPGSCWLELEGMERDGDGVAWEYTYHFELTGSDPHADVSLSVRTDHPRDLLRLSGPPILAGEGSFGGERDQALFCGLEYLQGEERSSGTDFAYEPGNLRVVPHPLKVTIPLMAVEEENATIAMSWDPLGKWDGANAMPSAQFLSTNWIQDQENHVMSLFVPTVPVWVDENEDVAHTPYHITGPLNISSRIFARANAGIIEALKWYLDTEGLPEIPPEPRSYEETIELCTRCYKDICWVDEYKAWKHTYLDDPSWIFWDAMVAVALWHHSVLTDNDTLREEIRDQVSDSVAARGGWGPDMDLALHMGEIDKAFASGYGSVRSLADTQRQDGSWPFTPTAGREKLGTPGDTSSGWTASKARTLLKFGRITGDPEAISAGLKALDYLDTQTRPEGAQTWELQLHVPDVLASSYVMECYLEAYRITGRAEYLEKARYWALTGLPFIYLWNPEDRPIMRYGSIPVFGATQFVSPWFGIIVQWNGLDYAYRLYDLSRYDDSFPWETIAEGITTCGMQMQRYPGGPYEQFLGMYPDAYGAVKGTDQYFFDINPRFISLCVFALMGQDETTQTQIVSVGDRDIHISTVGKLHGGRWEDATLAFETEYGKGDTSYALVGGISRPDKVEVNGRELPEADDISQVQEGWTHRSEGILVIRIVHEDADLVRVSGAEPQANQQFSPIPEWHFNGRDAQGWTVGNMLEAIQVEDGVLKTGSTGADPFMYGPSIRVDARTDAIIQINMSVTAGMEGQVFWVRKDSGGYSESKSMKFNVIPDGAFHLYSIPVGESPEWSNTIRQLRLDPTNMGEAEILVDLIMVPEGSIFAIGLLALAILGRKRNG